MPIGPGWRRVCTLAALLASISVTSLPVQAQEGPPLSAPILLAITNDAKSPLRLLTISVSGSTEDTTDVLDVLGSHTIRPGATAVFSVDGQFGCNYDVTVGMDGSPGLMRRVNQNFCVRNIRYEPIGGRSVTGKIDLINFGDAAVTSLYVRATGETSWGTDRLGGHALAKTQAYTLPLPASGACQYDVYARYPGDRHTAIYNQNLCPLTALSLVAPDSIDAREPLSLGPLLKFVFMGQPHSLSPCSNEQNLDGLGHALTAVHGVSPASLTAVHLSWGCDTPIQSELYKTAVSSIYEVTAFDLKGDGSYGSAVAIDASGKLLTNCHVVMKVAEVPAGTNPNDQPYNGEYATILVRPKDGQNIAATLIERRPELDLCLLSVAAKVEPVPGIRLFDGLEVGEPVYAIGNPEQLSFSFTTGSISQLRKGIGFGARVPNVDAIQFSAPISHGSSGGALLDAKGMLVGITQSILGEGQNLNFAIPAELLFRAAPQPPARAVP